MFDPKALRRIFDLDEEETLLVLNSLVGEEDLPPRTPPAPETRYWPDEQVAA